MISGYLFNDDYNDLSLLLNAIDPPRVSSAIS